MNIDEQKMRRLAAKCKEAGLDSLPLMPFITHLEIKNTMRQQYASQPTATVTTSTGTERREGQGVGIQGAD